MGVVGENALSNMSALEGINLPDSIDEMEVVHFLARHHFNG